MLKTFPILTILCSVFLISCSVSPKSRHLTTVENASAASDDALCQAYPHFKDNMKEAVYHIELQRRDLGTCEPDHMECRRYGHRSGTPSYGQCILQLRQIQAQEKNTAVMEKLIRPAQGGNGAGPHMGRPSY